MKQLVNRIANFLIAQKSTLSTAESCTGGNIAHLLTAVAGASNYYAGGVVAYSSSIKVEIIGVEAKIIKNYTVVSAQVAKAMALGVQKKFKTDYAIATTGNAGPTIDNTEEDIGVVFIAIATPLKVDVKKYTFSGTRKEVIEKASNKALNILFQDFLKN